MVNLTSTAQLSRIDHRMYERALGHLAADCVNDYQILDGRDIVAGVERLGDEGASYRPSKRLQIHSLAALGELAQLKKIQKHQSSLDEWNSCDDQGHTPLLISIMYGRLDVALYLLEAGANAGHSTQIGMNAFHLLARYRPKQDRDIEQVHELAARLKEGGANPNQQLKPTKSLADILGPVNKSQWWEVTYSSEEFFATPLMHAIWHGENEVVSAILDARAIPNLDSVHLAAGLHRSDLLEMLFSHQNFPFTTNDDFRLNGTRLITTAVDNEAHGGIFSPLRRLMLSRKIQSESSKKTYDRILSRCGLHQLSLDITLPNGQQGLIPRWEHCFTRRSVDLRLLKTLGSLNQDDLGMPTVHMETPLHRAIKVGHEEAVQFLLGSKLVDPKDKAEDGLGALHLCAMHTDNVAICKALLNSGCDANEKITEKASHSLQTPYQIAVAKQHFLMAGCLFEKGANRDQELFSATDSTQDLTLLGWLIRNSWDVSKHQIRYLFEEYKNMPPPDFIVAPEIGLSALQSVACYTPRSKFDEPSTEAMIDYLLSKYSSYQHLEYQRRDMNRKNQSDLIRVDTPTEGILKDSTGAYRYNWENIYFLGRTYETTRDRAYNGTALLQAVRAVNYPAVDSLIKAGANTAAVIGSHAEDLWGGMTSMMLSPLLG